MTSQHFVFRSKRERDQEVELLKKYREIGIAAIAAASRKSAPASAEISAPRRVANGRD